MVNIPINFEGLDRINNAIKRINRRFRNFEQPVNQLNNNLGESINRFNRINRATENFSNAISQIDMSSTVDSMRDIRNLSESGSEQMRNQVRITRQFERRAGRAGKAVNDMTSQIRNGVLQAEAMKFAFSAVANVISSGVGFAIDSITTKFEQFQNLVSEQFSKAQESSKAIRSQANSFVSILEKATGEEQDMEEVTQKIKRIRAQLAQAAAELPVSNQNILQVFDAISDDLTSQVYEGDLKKLEKGLQDQGGLVGKVALAVEDSTASWAEFNQDMNQYLAGQVQDVGWIADVAANRNKFEDVLKDFGIPSIKEFKKATEGDVKKKFEILQEWTDMLFTEEYIESMGNTLKGAQEGIKSLIFDTESGLLGFNRDVEVIRKEYQNKSKEEIEKLIKTRDDITEEMVFESTTLFNEIEKFSVPIIKQFSNVISSIFNISGSSSDFTAPLLQGIFNLRKTLEENIFDPIKFIIKDFNNSPELQKNPGKFVGQMLGRIADKIIDSLSEIFSFGVSSSSLDIKSRINKFIDNFINGIKEELGGGDIKKLNKLFEESIGFLETLFESLGEIINDVWDKISPVISPLISKTFNMVVNLIVKAIQLASPFIQPIIKGLLKILGTTLIEVFKSDIRIPLALVGTLLIGPITSTLLSALFSSLSTAISGALSSSWFIGLVSNPAGWIALGVLAVSALIKALEKPLSNLANNMQNNGFFLVRWFGDFLEDMVNFWSGIFDVIWGIVTLNVDKIKNGIKKIFNVVWNTIRKLDPRTWGKGRDNPDSPEFEGNDEKSVSNDKKTKDSEKSNFINNSSNGKMTKALEKSNVTNQKIRTVTKKNTDVLSKKLNDLTKDLGTVRNQNKKIISNIKQASMKNTQNLTRISQDINTSSTIMVSELKLLRTSVSSDVSKMSSKLDKIAANPYGFGDGDQGVPSGGGAITSIGKTLVNSGYNAWQHPDFNLNSGYTGSGSERVWMRPYNSYHNAGRALDFPVSHNSPQALDKLYQELLPLRQQGILKELIWRGPGHYDHLHMAANQGYTDPLKEELKKKPANSKVMVANSSETILNPKQTKEVASSMNSGSNINVNVNFYGNHSARESAELVAQEIQKAIENSKDGRV